MQSRFTRLYPEQVAGLERALPMYVSAIAQWQALAADLDADIELKLTGGLMVGETAEQIGFLAAKCRREAELGLPVRMLDRTNSTGLRPILAAPFIGAELCAIEGKLNPLLANTAIRQKLRGQARQIRSKRPPVLGLARSASSFEVTTAAGNIIAKRVVIAAGSGSRALAASLGANVPTEAEPLHMNITERTVPIIGHLVQHAERSITLKQLAAGHVVIGGGWPARLQGPREFPAVELSSLIGNLSLAQHVVPRIGALRLLRTWAGINTTVDGRSVLGEVPWVPGLYVALPGDAGYTLGPLCARLVADAMLGAAPQLPIEEYSPARFA